MNEVSAGVICVLDLGSFHPGEMQTDVRAVLTPLLMARAEEALLLLQPHSRPSVCCTHLSECFIRQQDSRADESRRLQDNHTRPSDSDTIISSLALSSSSLSPSLMRLSCQDIGRSISRSLLPPLNFYYSISPSLIPSHPGTQAALSLIHRITIHEFIEYDMERMVLTSSLSGSALMDPSFFILHCLKDKNPSSKAKNFLLKQVW